MLRGRCESRASFGFRLSACIEYQLFYDSADDAHSTQITGTEYRAKIEGDSYERLIVIPIRRCRITPPRRKTAPPG